MINKDELLFVVDEHNQALEPLPRSVVHQKVLWHRTTGIWVINKKMQILCEKRSKHKDMNPGLWDVSFGGHLAPMQTYSDNAIIELSEELGIEADKTKLVTYKIMRHDTLTDKIYEHIFLYRLDRTDTNFSFEKDEVDEIQWFDLDEVKQHLLHSRNSEWVHKPWNAEVLEWLENYKFLN